MKKKYLQNVKKELTPAPTYSALKSFYKSNKRKTTWYEIRLRSVKVYAVFSRVYIVHWIMRTFGESHITQFKESHLKKTELQSSVDKIPSSSPYDECHHERHARLRKLADRKTCHAVARLASLQTSGQEPWAADCPSSARILSGLFNDAIPARAGHTSRQLFLVYTSGR